MPKIVDHDAQREEIAGAAARAIARAGLEGATMRAVAKEAGCSTGPLAHYFGDKSRILVHALRHTSRKTGDRMVRQLRRGRGIAALRSVLEEALPLDGTRKAEWRVWLSFWGRAATHPDLAAEQARRYEEWRVLVQGGLESARVEGELASGLDLEREAEAIVALVDGIGIQAMFEPSRFTPEHQLTIVDAYLERITGADSGRAGAQSPRTDRR